MKATIKPLKGKHYGTEIEIEDGDIKTSIKVWCNADCEPSQRELDSWEITREQWDKNEVINNCDSYGEFRAHEMVCDGHFESQWQYDLCKKIAEAINSIN